MKDLASIKKDIQTFCNKYNFKEVGNKGSFYIYSGKIDIIDPDEQFCWDSFKVKYYIDLNFYYYRKNERKRDILKTYSNFLPIVQLQDHDEIKIALRHISQEDGSCCLAPNVECQEILTQDYTLIDFTEKLVIPFFAAQVYFSETGNWPFGDYEHYEKGLVQYYTKKLNVSEQHLIEALRILCKQRKIERNDICFCGSGQKYKKCHLDIIEHLKFYINQIYFQEDLQTLEKYFRGKA